MCDKALSGCCELLQGCCLLTNASQWKTFWNLEEFNGPNFFQFTLTWIFSMTLSSLHKGFKKFRKIESTSQKRNIPIYLDAVDKKLLSRKKISSNVKLRKLFEHHTNTILLKTSAKNLRIKRRNIILLPNNVQEMHFFFAVFQNFQITCSV